MRFELVGVDGLVDFEVELLVFMLVDVCEWLKLIKDMFFLDLD
jgi:hypothetical protein